MDCLIDRDSIVCSSRFLSRGLAHSERCSILDDAISPSRTLSGSSGFIASDYIVCWYWSISSCCGSRLHHINTLSLSCWYKMWYVMITIFRTRTDFLSYIPIDLWFTFGVAHKGWSFRSTEIMIRIIQPALSRHVCSGTKLAVIPSKNACLTALSISTRLIDLQQIIMRQWTGQWKSSWYGPH